MKRLMALVLLCSFSLAAQAMVSLTNWKPGDPGTTRQVWQFDTNASLALPEIDENQYGDATANIFNKLHPEYLSWADGIWSGSKFSITMDIPNNPVANPWKEVLVEIIYKGTIVMDSAKNDKGVSFKKRMSYDDCLDNGWMKRIDLWYIEPNPNSETLCYGFNPAVTGAPAAVDSISVSTICIPEPITMVLLSLGAIVLRKVK